MKLLFPLFIFIFLTQENKLEGEWVMKQESYYRPISIKFESNHFTVWKEFKGEKDSIKNGFFQIKDTTDYTKLTLNNKNAFITTDRVTKDLDTVFYKILNDTLYTKTYKLNNGIRIVNLETKFFKKK